MEKRTRFSVLDLAPVKERGTVAEAFSNSVSLAQHVEKLGYTRFWLAEHHNMPGIASAATSILISHVAAATSTLRIGSGGIMLPNHSALVIAEQFGTLESLYPGRIDLGVGRAPGGDGAAARALRRGLNSTEEEFPQQVKDLLEFLASPTPEQKVRAFPGMGTNVPVWLLGSSTYSAQLAARLGLPFAFASHFAPQELLEALYLYRVQFRPSVYLKEPYAMAGVPVVAAETDRDAERLATTPYQRALRLIRGEPLFLVPPVETMNGLWSDQERAFVYVKLGASIAGGPAKVAGKLKAFVNETKVDEIIVVTDLYDLQDRLRSYQIVADVMKSL